MRLETSIFSNAFSGGSKISQRGCAKPKGGANLLLGQFSPKTAWKWRNFGLEGGIPRAPQIRQCHFTKHYQSIIQQLLPSSHYFHTAVLKQLMDDFVKSNHRTLQQLLQVYSPINHSEAGSDKVVAIKYLMFWFHLHQIASEHGVLFGISTRLGGKYVKA